MKKPLDHQLTLIGMESHLCECGCGQYFMRATRGNRARYLSKTHKKRAARRLAAARRGPDVKTRLQPLGWLFLATGDTDTAKHLWGQLTAPEQRLLEFICATGMTEPEISTALRTLFDVRK